MESTGIFNTRRHRGRRRHRTVLGHGGRPAHFGQDDHRSHATVQDPRTPNGDPLRARRPAALRQ